MPQRKSWKLCKLILISFRYFISRSFRFWQKSRFENLRWAADYIGTTNCRRSLSAVHLGFSNRDFFQIWHFLLKCYPKLITRGLHNCSGCLHWVILLLLWFENQYLFCAWFVYMHPTLSKWLSWALYFRALYILKGTACKYLLSFKYSIGLCETNFEWCLCVISKGLGSYWASSKVDLGHSIILDHQATSSNPAATRFYKNYGHSRTRKRSNISLSLTMKRNQNLIYLWGEFLDALSHFELWTDLLKLIPSRKGVWRVPNLYLHPYTWRL